MKQNECTENKQKTNKKFNLKWMKLAKKNLKDGC